MKTSIKLFTLLFVIINAINAQIKEDTIKVVTGWNMVGSLYSGTVSSIIRTEPSGIISSEFFGYNPAVGYNAMDTLKKGYGYWVKVSENGVIIFGSTTEWLCGNTLEYSGKTYNTVQIGSQCWMKENLDVGTMISGIDTSKDNGIIEKYCYNDSIEYCNIYGGLYQWNEAMQYTTTPGARGICPTGWHIPTLAEFQTLYSTVGGNGNSLKAIGQGTGSGAGTNTSGFTALLAGYRNLNGSYDHLLDYATFWNSTESNSTYASSMYLFDDSNTIYIYEYDNKEDGFSVRCLKD